MPDDLKNYKAPLGSFQVITPAVAELLIVVAVALVFLLGIVPDLHAWACK